MVAAGLLALALFFALYLFFNLTVAGQSLENGWAWKYEVFDTVGYWFRQHDLPPLSHDRDTIMGGTLVAAVLALSRRLWRRAAWVAVATPGAVLASEGFKTVFDRPLLVDSRDDAVSYPSGHAVIALAVSAALLLVVPRSWQRWVVPVVGVWMALAASTIIVIGDHRPSEIVGAALLTIAVFLLTGAVAHLGAAPRPESVRTSRTRGEDELPAGGATRTWIPIALIAAIVATGLAAAWGALPWVTVIDGLAGAAASLMILGTATVTRSWLGEPRLLAREPVTAPAG